MIWESSKQRNKIPRADKGTHRNRKCTLHAPACTATKALPTRVHLLFSFTWVRAASTADLRAWLHGNL